MENASKALLIAGAVLIVILIIGVGMLIFSGAQGAIGEGVSKMNAQEKSMFNNGFISYEGSQKGTQVRALLNEVMSNNSTNTDTPEKRVSITGIGTVDCNTQYGSEESNRISTIRSGINTNRTYKVVLTYSEFGLVNNIDIQ